MKFRMTRRKFVRVLIGADVASVGGVGYSLCEAGWLHTVEDTLVAPKLPQAFHGARVAFLTDIHHGPYTSLSYVEKIVERTQQLAPNLILLGGDYVLHRRKYIAPCFRALEKLRAPLGVFGVLGNHDHMTSASETRTAMRSAGIADLTNTGHWIEKSGQRLRIAGVGDLWKDTQDLAPALRGVMSEDACILLSHNPDYVETLNDTRVGLVLSGHTHGGQVVLPLFGAPIVPSRYGQKYLRGLVRTPWTQVFVSRGLGTITPPMRFCCRPEINLITLT